MTRTERWEALRAEIEFENCLHRIDELIREVNMYIITEGDN